jgi:hypothetical protein
MLPSEMVSTRDGVVEKSASSFVLLPHHFEEFISCR